MLEFIYRRIDVDRQRRQALLVELELAAITPPGITRLGRQIVSRASSVSPHWNTNTLRSPMALKRRARTPQWGTRLAQVSFSCTKNPSAEAQRSTTLNVIARALIGLEGWRVDALEGWRRVALKNSFTKLSCSNVRLRHRNNASRRGGVRASHYSVRRCRRIGWPSMGGRGIGRGRCDLARCAALIPCTLKMATSARLRQPRSSARGNAASAGLSEQASESSSAERSSACCRRFRRCGPLAIGSPGKRAVVVLLTAGHFHADP